jgi:predicted ATP-dependent endonuclease of OLD family
LENFKLCLAGNYCAISGKNNAGKSAVIKIIQYFLGDQDETRFSPVSNEIYFSKDKTQWSNANEMEISIEVSINRVNDSETFFVVEKLSADDAIGDYANVIITQSFKESRKTISCSINGRDLDTQTSSEVLKKFKSASNLVVHNSTNIDKNFFFTGEDFTEIHEAYFSDEDKKRIVEAEKSLQTRVRRAAKQHKEDLDKLLGRLNEKYHVELTSINRGRSSRFPLELKLTDNSVEVPLIDWGSGTQNRTRVLISALEAIRIRSQKDAENRSTPVFIVEEPESFLHPSAQAEFGQVLNGLATELDIQIIATTHSPYMLNQSNPAANHLLERRTQRGKLRETILRDTSGTDWMLPFADNLGVVPSEFESWRHVFDVHAHKALLVEGDIDKEYIEAIRDNYKGMCQFPDSLEIVSYGGKDALNNTAILQFMIKKFGKVFITYDLDAEIGVRRSLERIGLIEGTDFCGVGAGSPGNDCIEGLVPTHIKQKVYADHYDSVSALGSQDKAVRNSAKSKIKRALLNEFKSALPAPSQIPEFSALMKKISKAFQ